MFNKVQHIWLKLIGNPGEFRLESRIFHSIVISTLMVCVFYVPYNLFAGMYMAAFSCVVFVGLFTLQYYNSRFHHKPYNTALFAITGLIIFSVNYFANAGIHGSTDIIWPGYLLLVFAISPYRQHMLWLIIYVACFMVLHVAAYYHPDLIKYPFELGKGQLIDRMTAFPLPVIAVFIVIKYIRQSHDKERVIAEEKAGQLEKSNVEKDKLMSIVSHDMRAPLINIQGYLQLLQEQELESSQRALIERELLLATNNTMDMLTNLLQWSKSQMEGPSINLKQVNLLATIQSTLDMGVTQAIKKDIRLSYNINPHLQVTADTDMLQLVVRNLLSNAIKFTPQGGVINVSAQQAASECKIVVADNGKGIQDDQQGKIFSINTQPGLGTNNEKGVGLGLMLCKEFIERQGGRIGFESVFGRGSSFFIFIPLG